MKNVNAAYKLVCIIFVTLLGTVLLLAGSAPLVFLPKLRWRWRNYLVQAWSKSILSVMRLRLIVAGTPPRSGCYVVSNHLSYLDIPLLFTQLGCIFVARADLATWPALGLLSRLVDTVFIQRSRKKDIPRVNALIEKHIEEKKTIVVFPEGTSSPGNDVLPFKPSLLQPLTKHEYPVCHATIHYSTDPSAPPAHLAVCWWGDMTFAGHFWKLLRLDRIYARVEFGAVSLSRTDRKQLARDLWLQVKQQFIPTVA